MIKKGTQVEILCGKDKGKKGEVIEILRSKNRAKVKGITLSKNTKKRDLQQTPVFTMFYTHIPRPKHPQRHLFIDFGDIAPVLDFPITASF